MAATSVFELAKKRAQQKATESQQQSTDALKRRFAQMGALQSGAAIKQEQLVAEKTQEQLGQELEGIGAQEAEFNRQQQEVKEGREWQAGQADIQRKFESGESALGRAFATAEAQKGREFTSGENLTQRKFESGESALGRAFATAEAQKGREFTSGENLTQRQHQEKLMGMEQEYNRLEAEKQRAFAAGENEKAQRFQGTQAEIQRNFEEQQNFKARELQRDQFNTEMKFKKSVQAWNKSQAADEYKLLLKQYELDKSAQEYNTRLSQEMARLEGADIGYLRTGKYTPAPTPAPASTSRYTPSKPAYSSAGKYGYSDR